METNFFYNIYNKKSDEELKQVVHSNGHTDDAKLCAVKILVERGHKESEFSNLKHSLEEKITLKRSEINYRERYDTGLSRFGALVLDGIIISVIGWFLKLFYVLDSVLLIAFIGIVELIIPYAYSIVMHGCCGQTIGKMAANVKVFDKSEEKAVSYKQALYREIVPLGLIGLLQIVSLFGLLDDTNFVLYLTFLVLSVSIVWSIMEIVTMLFDTKRRALHDYIAGTVVLKVHSRN
ncbi:RDD family protein [Carboxylicivirga sp. A043]|uniref:RDD family protein n=1 Tax=Carboxylicivirga litoralis TaxID=2816963 RepID=UPI0021CB0258|nr:RDD family protein [Carboxylicivirga sp. A043]MCU4155196.1 RDD family protein [Carboxylicivirga sp. A043]